jgi:H+-translocating NAD(P) transhydrogenase subunit beta
MQAILPFLYLLASVGFILALKWMSSPATARRGVFAGEIGMLLAVVGTLLRQEVVDYQWILIAFFLGTAVGVPLAYLMPMTAVPQRTALSHSFGALASALIGTAEYYRHTPNTFVMSALVLETLLGFLTFTASLMAFGKLQEVLPTRPITYRGQNFVNLSLFAVAAVLGVALILNPAETWMFPIFAGLSLLFGVLLIIPIGGADMPTVIALLNSYAGLSASAMGFALDNKLLIIAGALDGSSGLILAIIMCKAMNRSFTNVLFGAFGTIQTTASGATEQKAVRSATPEEAASILESARSVIIIPGYGLAVAQAQHKIREMYDALTRRGVDVRFAIHPVAGRMPGHMNVLLAEADVPYDKLIEMDEINPEFPVADVALVIGANDVVNPAARTDKNSPIAGMPILNRRHRQRALLYGKNADALRRRKALRRQHRQRDRCPRSGLARQRLHVDHKPVLHVALHQSRVSIVDLRCGDQFDFGGDAMLAAEVEHLLRFGNATDQRPSQPLAAHDQTDRGNGQRLLGNPNQTHRPVPLQQLQIRIDVMLGRDRIDDEIKAPGMGTHRIRILAVTTEEAPSFNPSSTLLGDVVNNTTSAPNPLASFTATWPKPPKPTTPTFWPGPTFQCRNGEYVVMPAQSSGATAARFRLEGTRNTKRWSTTILPEYPPSVCPPRCLSGPL